MDKDDILSAWGSCFSTLGHRERNSHILEHLHGVVALRVTHAQWLRTAVLALLNGDPPPIEVTAKAPFHPLHFHYHTTGKY